MSHTDAEIKERLDKYFGPRYETVTPTMVDTVKIILSMPAENRHTMIRSLRAFMCLECGSDDPRCKCWNDE